MSHADPAHCKLARINIYPARRQQCLAKATAAEHAIVTALLNMMPELTASDSEADDGAPRSEDQATSTTPSSSSAAAAVVETAVVEAPATHRTPRRRLRRGFSTSLRWTKMAYQF